MSNSFDRDSGSRSGVNGWIIVVMIFVIGFLLTAISVLMKDNDRLRKQLDSPAAPAVSPEMEKSKIGTTPALD